MAGDLIPLDQLTDAEVTFMIQQKAEDEAWDLYPLDPIYRENDIKKRRERIEADLIAMAKEVIQGKRDMPGIHPTNCGRDPSVGLRPHRYYSYYKMMKSAGPTIRGRKRRTYTHAQIERLGFLTDADVKLLSLHPDSSKIIDPFHLRLWFLVSPQADAIRPVLRLASRLLMSPPSVKFLHALRFNRRSPEYTARRIWDRELTEIRYDENQNTSTAEMTIPVMKVLTELSKDLNWKSFNKNDPDDGPTELESHLDADGFTVYRKVSKGSDIFINCIYLNYLEKLMFQSHRSPQTICITMRLRLYLAVVLCHELCHALNRWVNHSQHWVPEPFFMNYNLTECGFTCKSPFLTRITDLANGYVGEQEVFGGQLSYAWSDYYWPNEITKAPLRIEKWPRAYDYGDHIMNEDLHQPSNLYIRKYPKASSTSYLIWMRWVESLFLDENWDKVMAEDRLDCLRPGKSFGYRVWGHPQFVDPDWRRSQSSEAIKEDWRGRVLHEPSLKSQLTPTPPTLLSYMPTSPSYSPTTEMNLPPTWDRDAAQLRGYSPADPTTWTPEIMFGSTPYDPQFSESQSMWKPDGIQYSPTDPNFTNLNSGTYTEPPPQASPTHPDYAAWASGMSP